MRSDAEVIRHLFADCDPARDVGGSQVSRASAELITMTPPRPEAGQRRGGTSRRRLLLSGSVAVAAAAAIMVGGLVVLHGPAEPTMRGPVATPALLAFRTGGETVSAREMLLKAAASAEGQPDAIGTGKYQYVETQGWYLNTSVAQQGTRSAVIPVLRRQWIAADGSGRTDTTPQPAYFPSASDRQAWENAGHPGPTASSETHALGGLHLMWQPGSLRPYQTTLKGQLEVGHPADLGPAETLVAVSDLYGEQPVPPAVRAAVLRL